MKKFPTSLLLALATAAGLASPATAELAWLSDVKPGPAGHHGGEHNHGGPVERGRGGVIQKRLWLRDGAAVTADYAHAPGGQTTLHLLDPRQRLTALTLKPEDHGSLAFPMPDEGYYNVYLVGEHRDGDITRLSVAKAEVLRHSCREGHDHVAPLVPPNAWDGAPLDIVRERLDDENFHTLLGSGDAVGFRILHYGRPAAGARVTMHTQEGWRRSIAADAEGRVRFQLIRDYYPDWDLFNRRNRETFLVEARYDVAEQGRLTEHVASYAGAYHPSPRDYASYSHGLLAGLAGLTLTGGGVLLRRRRRGGGGGIIARGEGAA